jgi:hypothetical protein
MIDVPIVSVVPNATITFSDAVTPGAQLFLKKTSPPYTLG